MRVLVIPLVLLCLAGCATKQKSAPTDPWTQTLRLAQAEEARPFTSVTPLTTALAAFDASADAFLVPGKPQQPMHPAVQVLVTWHRNGGGFGQDPCLGPLEDRPLELLQLGRYALLTADSIEDPQVAATLALADGLRDYGGFLQGLVGTVLFADTVQWASERGLDGRALLAPHVPRTAEFVEMSAREWVCSIRQIEKLLQEPHRSTTISELAQMNDVSAESLESSIDAELERFRTAVAGQIVRMAERPGDPAWISKHTDFGALKEQAGPFGVLLNDTTASFKSFEETLATWAEYERRGPRKVEPPAVAERRSPVAPWVPSSLKRISEDTLTISEDELTRDDLNAIATQARIAPAFEDGKVTGFKIFGIVEGGVFDVLGLEKGDVVEQLNGIVLTSPEEVLRAWDTTKAQKKLHLVIRRGDAVIERYVKVVPKRKTGSGSRR